MQGCTIVRQISANHFDSQAIFSVARDMASRAKTQFASQFQIVHNIPHARWYMYTSTLLWTG